MNNVLYLPKIDTVNLQQFAISLESALKTFESERRKFCTALVNDALATLKERVQDKGVDSTGSRYEAYSDNPLPAWYYLGKSRGEQLAGGARTYSGSGYSAPFKRMVSQQAKGGKSFHGMAWSYKDWREANNLQTEHKDFSFTGKMWKNIKVRVGKSGNGILTLRIEPTAQDEIKKLGWNEDRHGPILALTDRETKVLETRYESFVHNHFNKILR